MFNKKTVNIARKILDSITSTLFLFFQIFLRYKENRKDYGIQIFEYFYLPWRSDNDFIDIYSKIKLNTINPIYRLYTIYDLAKIHLKENSTFVEVGSWRGGVSAMIASAFKSKNVTFFACDTFNGVVNSSVEDSFFKNSEYKDASINDIEDLNRKLDLNIKPIQGIFPNSFNQIKLDNKISFAHIDVDTFISAKESFDFIFNKMDTGGVIVLDDYGGWFTDGVTTFGNSLKKEKIYFAYQII